MVLCKCKYRSDFSFLSLVYLFFRYVLSLTRHLTDDCDFKHHNAFSILTFWVKFVSLEPLSHLQ